MERHFVLPVMIAAAIHVALLFGFTKVPRVVSVAAESLGCTFEIPLFVETEPPTANDDERGRAESAQLIDPPPRAPEPVVQPTVTDRVMPVPVPSSVDPNDIRKIAETLIGTTPGGSGTGWSHGPILPNELDNPPRTRFQAAPVYPFEAKRRGERGEVMVEFLVDEEGRVREPRVLKSSHAVFEEATLRAVSKWMFEPGRRNGRIVRFRMAVPVVFNLND